LDIALLIRHRLKELGLDQKDLAGAAEVTESYVSQLLTRKKAPPAPERTDIYEKFGAILKLPAGELAKFADLQRRETYKRKIADPARPLFQQLRELVLRKCEPERQAEVRQIFAKEPFGELERLITQTILDVAQGVAAAGLQNEGWQGRLEPLIGRSHEQTRVAVLEFLDTDVFNVSVEGCVAFLDPLIESWDIDLKTFSITVTLNPKLTAANRRRFAFSEQPGLPEPMATEPGFAEFLKDSRLSGDASEEELAFLKSLRLGARRPTALYYYRELQNMRDPLHFRNDGDDVPATSLRVVARRPPA
jgi:transcriptional regulator with XRE-family HTH domain